MRKGEVGPQSWGLLQCLFVFPDMITWSVVLQYFVTRLVLVCIYVTPPMKHIYTGIKYIALYNIIYVCGIEGIF